MKALSRDGKTIEQARKISDEVLVEQPAPATCTESFDTTAITAHVDNMAFEGWGAVNEDNGIRMFGCAGSDPSQCFTSGSFADRSSDWGVAGTGTGAGAAAATVALAFALAATKRVVPVGW